MAENAVTSKPPDYTFRIRLELPARESLGISARRVTLLETASSNALELCSGEKDRTLKEAKRVVMRQSGWESEDAAMSAGRALMDPLMRTLAVLSIGAELGERAAKSMFTEAGLAMLERKRGRRMLNDFLGLMVFETHPSPQFIKQQPTLVRHPEEGSFQRFLAQAVELGQALSSNERVAFHLFSGSFFEASEDTRLLMLMMAMESLLDLEIRPEASLSHVETLIDLTAGADGLSESERASILGSLSWLRRESIGQAGRRLAATLEPRTYAGLSPPRFFDRCYSLRSALAHGANPLPSREEVGDAAAHLERLVGHLIGGGLVADLKDNAF